MTPISCSDSLVRNGSLYFTPAFHYFGIFSELFQSILILTRRLTWFIDPVVTPQWLPSDLAVTCLLSIFYRASISVCAKRTIRVTLISWGKTHRGSRCYYGCGCDTLMFLWWFYDIIHYLLFFLCPFYIYNVHLFVVISFLEVYFYAPLQNTGLLYAVL